MFSLPNILLALASISVGAAVIAAIIMVRSAREARSTIFPIVREEETLRSRRARIAMFIWLALVALFFGGWLATWPFIISDQALPISEAQTTQPAQTAIATQIIGVTASSEIIDLPPTELSLVETETPGPATPTPEPLSMTSTPSPMPATAISTQTPVPPTATATQTPVPPTATETFTVVPTGTPTSIPTDTPTPIPTDTPVPAPTETSISESQDVRPAEETQIATSDSKAPLVGRPTPVPRTPAPAGVKMGPIQFATQITSDTQAISPTDLFPKGVETIYAVFPFSGMQNGLKFKAIWYQNGVETWRDEKEWEWGGQSRSYTFLNPNSEEDGLYKLELYVNDSVVATDLFEIR